MLENSIYSILSPEGFASILYKDSNKASQIVKNMKITADDLKNLEIIDEIIREPEGGAQEDIKIVAKDIKKYIINQIQELQKKDKEELIEQRYEKYRKIGI